MKNYNVVLQPIAQTDIKNIGDYIAQTLCNPEAAVKLMDAFAEQFERIAHFPLSGKPLNLDLPLEFDYFQAFVENYVILYIVDDSTETATVMRILYVGSDYLARLLSEPTKQ